jgi:Dolichyl-phosphate-mannose-protein mannosyltransferase
MIRTDNSPHRLTSGPAIVLYIAAVKFFLHIATANRYGIFRDEMYYWAGSMRMAWGYVDHPPLTVWLAWIARHLFGNSPLGVRLLPALAGAALVWLTGKLTRELGGGRFAQAMAALAIVVVPVYLILHHWLTDNAWEPLIWMGCIWFIVRTIHTGDERNWIWFGVLSGIGFENKYSIAFLLFGLFVGIVLTPYRPFLRSRYLWFGALVCALIAMPNFLWQVMHRFPFLELMYMVRISGRDVMRGPVAFIVDQAEILNPALFPLWAGGVIWLFAGRGQDKPRYRLFGWAFLVVLTTFIVLKAKNYYVVPIYPMLFAAGAIGLERIGDGRGIGRWMRFTYVTIVIVAGIVLLPFSVPVLSPENYIRYQKALDIQPSQTEHQPNGSLPQWYADEFGWPEMVEKVASVYNSLPPEERARTAIFSNGWGEAAAVDFYGPKYGLPLAISKHNSYWIWGSGNYDGSTMIILRSGGRDEPSLFESVESVGRVSHPYSRRDEYFDILLCRGLKKNLKDIWPGVKSFN